MSAHSFGPIVSRVTVADFAGPITRLRELQSQGNLRRKDIRWAVTRMRLISDAAERQGLERFAFDL